MSNKGLQLIDAEKDYNVLDVMFYLSRRRFKQNRENVLLQTVNELTKHLDIIIWQNSY